MVSSLRSIITSLTKKFIDPRLAPSNRVGVKLRVRDKVGVRVRVRISVRVRIRDKLHQHS